MENLVLALPEEEIDRVSDVSKKCGTRHLVVVPVFRESGEIIKEVLAKGFELNWNANYSCMLSNSGSDDHSPRPSQLQDLTGKSSHGVLVPIALALAGVSAIIVIVIVICCLRKNSPGYGSIFIWKRLRKLDKNIENLLKTYGPIQVRRYSYSDVKKITRRFSKKLGQGGFGVVYKGELDGGCLVAVKVWNQTKGEDGEEFVNEVATISQTSHVNIVTLMGFCFEGSQRALIYEFMPNGSLEKFIIFGENETETVINADNSRLNWEMYFQISLGIARGLEYLHRGCNTRILHFDIKPHNILLDVDFVPKISDFGLAKFFAKRENYVSVLGPRGTIGYIAPEVCSRSFGGVSHKSDVYSYGIMILEMVGGRKSLDVTSGCTSEIYFPWWIYKRLELDEECLGLNRIENKEEQVIAKKMVMVSLWCIQTNPSHRPTMSKVIEMLEGSLDSLKVPPQPFELSPSTSSPTVSSIMF